MELKLQCLVADDEPAALSLMERYVQRTPFLELKGGFSNGIEVLDYLQQHEAPDLIFLDIQMPELNGIELGKVLPNQTKIVFTTAFDKYAVEGYKVNAIAYLLKPIDYSEFLAAAMKAKTMSESSGHSKQTGKGNEKERSFIFIKSEYKQLKINFKEILYIEGLKDYAKICLATDTKPVLSLITLKKLEEELPADKFMRVHRSFIIALDKISQVERGHVIINGVRIPLAEQYRAAFNDFVEKRSL